MMESNSGTCRCAATACISIIAPVYNVDAYLPTCVESILSQTYTNWELILVDDGSKDSSGELCDVYSQRDSRIRVIHQENQGVSAARNAGLELASGEYIAFIDSDDLVKPDYLEVLHRNLMEHDADIACCCSVAPGGEIPVNATLPLVRRNRVICDPEELYRDIVENQEIYWSCIWGKLFRAELAKKHRFRPMRYGEDCVYMYDIFSESPVVHLDLYEGYYYVNRSTSAMAVARGRNLRRLHDEMEMDYYRLCNLPDVCEKTRSAMVEYCARRVHGFAYAQVLLNTWGPDALRDAALMAVMQERKRLSPGMRRNILLLARTPWLYRALVKLRNAWNETSV